MIARDECGIDRAHFGSATFRAFWLSRQTLAPSRGPCLKDPLIMKETSQWVFRSMLTRRITQTAKGQSEVPPASPEQAQQTIYKFHIYILHSIKPKLLSNTD